MPLTASSLAFGLLHLANPVASVSGALGTTAAGGVMVCATYLLTRELWLAIGIHWAAACSQGVIFGLHPSGTTFSHRSCAPLWTGQACGPATTTAAD